MNLNDYQFEAQETDRVLGGVNSQNGIDLTVPLLGIAAKAGELLSEYMKHLRDGDSHLLFKPRIAEQLGDLLWYTANVAQRFDLKLSDVASQNLRKTKDMWLSPEFLGVNFDENFIENESFPRKFEVELKEDFTFDTKKVSVYIDGKPLGDKLTDNAEDPDGYRFHDIFHLSYVAILGWSPVVRKLLNRKRRSDKKIDEVQDGGRAQVIDEAISALVFEYARSHNWLQGVNELDYRLLRTIKDLTSVLEVKHREVNEWQKAILLGFDIWREVLSNRGGRILVDLDAKNLIYLGPSNSEI
jgi:NTP pyrophosphatase (non-canonical NTP hydrolase)